MQNAIVQLNCPACGSSDFSVIGNTADEFKVYGKDGGFFTHPSFSIHTCNNCNLYFKSAIPDYETLNRYYETLDNSYEDLDFLFPTDRKTIEVINAAGKGLKVLDYGCGTGRILNQLAAGTEKYGTELNAESIRIARSRNIKIIDDESLKGFEGYFDIVILTDVFEHLYKPLELIATLSKYIRPGGKMIIVTGNSDAIIQKKYSSGYWYFRLFSHLQMLNRKYAIWMAGKTGMEVENLVTCSHYDSPFSLKLKHKVAVLLFSLYKKSSAWGLWNNKRLSFVKTWTYPSFDSSNQDHLIIIFKKKQYHVPE